MPRIQHTGWPSRIILHGFILSTLALAAGGLGAPPAVAAEPGRSFVPDELLVGFRPGVARAEAEALYRGLGATRVEEIRQINVHRVRIPAGALARVEQALAARPEVEFVERNYLSGPDSNPGGGALPDELLVGFDASLSGVEAQDAYVSAGAEAVERIRQLRVHRIRVSPSLLQASQSALAGSPGVRFVERHELFAPTMVPDDGSYASEWHLQKIGAPAAWDVAAGAADVIIAILDSGVDPHHPDLAAKLVPGYNFWDNNTNTADVYGHGTAVAGTAAAIGNNGIGVAGVAWQSRIMPIRVTSTTGYASTSAVANGLTWAVDHGARVMNVSFGGVAASSTITQAAKYVAGKGGVVVAAAGNCGCVDSTADNPYIISVSATDQRDALASWSSSGNYVDVAAPGVGILTTYNGGGYGSASGTSFSSPITAGVVALMASASPALTPPDIERLLKANADDLGTGGWDASFGFGRINAFRAVAAAAGSSPSPTVTTTTLSIARPANVANFNATDTRTGGQIKLGWTNPETDFAGTVVLRRAGSPVSDTPTAGRTYSVGQSLGSSTVVYAGPGQSLSDAGLTDGTKYFYRAFAFSAARSYASGAEDSATPSLASTTCPAEVVVDNLAPGRSSSQVTFGGGWSTSSASGAYGANASLYSSGSGGDSYSWQTDVLNASKSCTYQVSVWWTSNANRSTSVPVTVSGHTAASATKTFNQQTGGGRWQLHGQYTFAPGARGVVRVTDANGQASADAVRFALASTTSVTLTSGPAPSPTPPQEIVMDNGAAGTSSKGSWCTSGAPSPFGGKSLYSCGSGQDIYQWTPTIPASGTYDVYVWWTSNANRSTKVPITVVSASGTTTRQFNQQTGGGQWQLHGRYAFSAGTAGYVTVTDASGQASADAVRFVPVTTAPAAAPPATVSTGGSGTASAALSLGALKLQPSPTFNRRP